MADASQSKSQTEEFLGLFTPCQHRIRVHIVTLLPNASDAEDVFQETCVILWRKFNEYQPGTNFAAWAVRIAYNTVLNARAKKRRSLVLFDSQLMEVIGRDAAEMLPELDRRRAALSACLARLPANDRALLDKRYEEGATIKSVATSVGRPLEGMYKAMRRIHDALFQCVQKRMAAD
jgi:RNA polymerase sigma-70 factor, ECF subfamily